jgi:hypothetical protein
VIAGIVAAIVIAFDAWLVIHHRHTTTPVAPKPLPTYVLLPVDAPPPSVPPPSTPPTSDAAPPRATVAEDAGSASATPTSHRHRHRHHRHSTTPQ